MLEDRGWGRCMIHSTCMLWCYFNLFLSLISDLTSLTPRTTATFLVLSTYKFSSTYTYIIHNLWTKPFFPLATISIHSTSYQFNCLENNVIIALSAKRVSFVGIELYNFQKPVQNKCMHIIVAKEELQMIMIL